MKKGVISLLAIVLGLYLLAVLVPIEPAEQRPGTRLSGDTVDSGTVDWSFIEGRKQIFVQTNTWYLIPHSVTTTSWVLDGELYVPCGACATKRWPRNVATDANVVLKIDEHLYERKAVLIVDPHEKHQILAVPHGHDLPGGVEVYRMESRD
jgi:hypothetical protein